MIKKEHMKGFPFLLLLICLIQFRVAAQEKDSITVAMQPIVVTASRIPTNSLYVSRTIDIIDEELIKTLGVTSVEELLQRESNVDIQPRGIFGVQSDVSIRGALFGQQLILLNSVRMNDAQTAHHNFDLPISLDQIERIEVLKGAGSALYGPDAYGTTIFLLPVFIHQTPLSTGARMVINSILILKLQVFHQTTLWSFPLGLTRCLEDIPIKRSVHLIFMDRRHQKSGQRQHS
jgi:hypothetical protein